MQTVNLDTKLLLQVQHLAVLALLLPLFPSKYSVETLQPEIL